MLLERLFHSHAFADIFLDTIIGFNKVWQQRDDFRDFFLWNDDHTIHDIAEYQISGLDNGTIEIKGNLSRVRLRFGARSNSGYSLSPDLVHISSANILEKPRPLVEMQKRRIKMRKIKPENFQAHIRFRSEIQRRCSEVIQQASTCSN